MPTGVGISRCFREAIFFFLCLAIGLLGVGRVEVPFVGQSFSSWSVSRTVFFFWLIWKVLDWARYGRKGLGWRMILPPVPVLPFFVFVTASLLPSFRDLGDYRYFVFGFFHLIMVLDLFSKGSRPRLLFILLSLAPGFLFLRGILSDPTLLSFSDMVRFGFPLDHPNTAGYIFAMAIPLSLVCLIKERGWLRCFSGLSLVAQFVGLALTYSRGAWAGCFASLLGLGLTQARARKVILAFGLLGSGMFRFITMKRASIFLHLSASSPST